MKKKTLPDHKIPRIFEDIKKLPSKFMQYHKHQRYPNNSIKHCSQLANLALRSDITVTNCGVRCNWK